MNEAKTRYVIPQVRCTCGLHADPTFRRTGYGQHSKACGLINTEMHPNTVIKEDPLQTCIDLLGEAVHTFDPIPAVYPILDPPLVSEKARRELIHHPSHYGGADNPYEAIKVIEAWKLGFNLGNTLKYIARRNAKQDVLSNLEKAAWYLSREITTIRQAREADLAALKKG
jgi:hypothetical protein